MKKVSTATAKQSRNFSEEVDVAQRVDEVAFLVYEYTAAPPEEQTTVGRIVPSNLLRNYNGGPLGDCSQLLRSWNKYGVSTLRGGFSANRMAICPLRLRIHDPN